MAVHTKVHITIHYWCIHSLTRRRNQILSLYQEQLIVQVFVQNIKNVEPVTT